MSANPKNYDLDAILEEVNKALKDLYKNKKYPLYIGEEIVLVPTTEDIANMLQLNYSIVDKAIIRDSYCEKYCNSDSDVWITVMWLLKLEYTFKYMKKEPQKDKIESFCESRGYTLEQLNYLLKPWIVTQGYYKFYLLKGAIRNHYRDIEIQKEQQQLALSETSLIEIKSTKYKKNELSNIIPIVYLNNEHFKNLSVSKMHKFEFHLALDDLGPTRLIPAVSEDETMHLDANGIIKVNTHCKGGEILVGNIRNKETFELTPEEKLLRQIFGEKAQEVKNISFYLPKNISGEIQSIKFESDIKKVTIYLKESFPLEIGDVLESENGSLAVLYGGYDVLTDDLYCNVDTFCNNIVKRTLFGCSKNVMAAISTSEYLYFHPWYAADENKFLTNQKLSVPIIKKFIRQGLFDVLQNLLLNTTSVKTRQLNYKEAVLGDKLERKFLYNEYIVEALVNYFYALGVKTEFKLKKDTNNNLNIEDIIHSPDLIVQMIPLRDDDIDMLSSGKCVRGCNFDKKTFQPEPGGLFDKNIFGTKDQYHCDCMSYKKAPPINMQVCPHCGHKIVNSYSYRMGHIELEEPQQNYIFPKEIFSKILVIPPKYRNFIINNGKITIRPINDAYSKIISENKAHARKKETCTEELIINYSKESLKRSVGGLYYSSSNYDYNHYQGAICEIYDLVKDALINVPLNYSAASYVIVNLELDEYTCKIPYRIAKELFKPYILNLLHKNGLTSTTKLGEKAIATDKYKSEIIEYFNNDLIPAHMYIMSASEEGKILRLRPIISNNNVIEMSKNNYVDMCIDIGDPATIFALSQNANLESDLNSIKFTDTDIKNFFNFIDLLSVDKATNNAKNEQVQLWIQKLNESPSLVNSIGFKLITGRNQNIQTRL